jgi:hypothetical protein
MMTTLKTLALGLSLLVTAAAPAFANAEQPHTAPIAPAFAAGQVGQDVGSERDPGFDLRAAVPLRAGGQVVTASEAGGGFDPARAVLAGQGRDGTVRFAGGVDRTV